MRQLLDNKDKTISLWCAADLHQQRAVGRRLPGALVQVQAQVQDRSGSAEILKGADGQL